MNLREHIPIWLPIATAAIAVGAVVLAVFALEGDAEVHVAEPVSSNEVFSPHASSAEDTDEASSHETPDFAQPSEVDDTDEGPDEQLTEEIAESVQNEDSPEAEPVDEVPETDEAERPESKPAGTGHSGPTGRIVVVTNFMRAQVTINGEPYRVYSDDGENRGMELPAHQPHLVEVQFDDNERVYEIELRPGERRLLMVELTGMNQRPVAEDDSGRTRPTRRQNIRDDDDEEETTTEEDGEDGRITVYSRPRGNIYIGGEDMGERTPSTVDVAPGRHEVRVEYEDGEMSETKTVRVREGARVQLFFREDD